MAIKEPIKILPIMLRLICLASFFPLPAVAAPKWPIPRGINTIKVNGYTWFIRRRAAEFRGYSFMAL